MDKIKSFFTIFLLAIFILVAWTTITFIISDDSEDLCERGTVLCSFLN
jgi:hypothetical protein